MGTTSEDKRTQLQAVFAATLKALVNEHPSKTPIWDRLAMGETNYKSIANASAALSPTYAFNMAQTFDGVDAASAHLLLSVLWALKDAEEHEVDEHLKMSLRVVPALKECLELIAEELPNATVMRSSVPVLDELGCHLPLLKFLKTPYPTKKVAEGDRTVGLQHFFSDIPSIYYSGLVEGIKASRFYPKHCDAAFSEKWEEVNARQFVQFCGMFTNATRKDIMTEKNIKLFNNYGYLIPEGYKRSCFLIDSDATDDDLKTWKDEFVGIVCRLNGLAGRAKRDLAEKVILESMRDVKHSPAKATLKRLFRGHDVMWSFRLATLDDNWVGFRRWSEKSGINGEVMTVADCDHFVQLMNTLRWK